MSKRRVMVYINENVWKLFLKYLVSKHGKTHGGVISKEIENAIKQLIESP